MNLKELKADLVRLLQHGKYLHHALLHVLGDARRGRAEAAVLEKLLLGVGEVRRWALVCRRRHDDVVKARGAKQQAVVVALVVPSAIQAEKRAALGARACWEVPR